MIRALALVQLWNSASAQTVCSDFGDSAIKPSPGVRLSPSTTDFQGSAVGPLPDGVGFHPTRLNNCIGGTLPGGSMGWVTTSYSPKPGSYQLFFEVANVVDNFVL
jgi:hypothetical protein